MAFLQIPVNFYRTQAEPLDTTSVYSSYSALTSYATTSPFVYPGQICSVIDDGAYIINSNKSVTKLGTGNGGNVLVKQYKTDYYGSSAVYIGSSLTGTLESSPDWVIRKSIYNTTGTLVSTVSAINIAWVNRYTI